MPTFDFRCKKCAAVFEFARPFGSKTQPACPKCKSKRTEKLMSAPTVVFKGSGWYKTDNRQSGGPSSAREATAGKQESEKKQSLDAARGEEGKKEMKKPEPPSATPAPKPEKKPDAKNS